MPPGLAAGAGEPAVAASGPAEYQRYLGQPGLLSGGSVFLGWKKVAELSVEFRLRKLTRLAQSLSQPLTGVTP